jgi:hypothetical protein
VAVQISRMANEIAMAMPNHWSWPMFSPGFS